MNSQAILCELCGSGRKNLYCKQGKFTYYQCKRCRGIYVWPKKTQKHYLSSKDYLTNPDDYLRLVDAKGQKFFLDKFEEKWNMYGESEKGNMLEIGAAVGHFAYMAFAHGWNVTGLETSKKASEIANKYLRMNVINSTIEDFSTNEKFNSVVAIEVIEHFFNAKESIQRIKELTTKGALFFGTTPNTDSSFWVDGPNIYVPEDHIFLFNKKSLRYLLKKSGAKKIQIEYFGGGKDQDSNLMFSAML